MTFLENILARTRADLEAERQHRPLSLLRERLSSVAPARPFAPSLCKAPIAVIAEVKKASPSQGRIRDPFDHRDIARSYVRGGAAALSILTNAPFFQGELAFLGECRTVADIPLLRKDFIVDPYQVVQSRTAGADALLLIAAALEPGALLALHRQATDLGMECLVEVHSAEELDRIDFSVVRLLGINNRDLRSFVVDLETTFRLRDRIPPGVTVVSESGITSGEHLRRMIAAGVNAVLIGEHFMRQPDPGNALARILAEGR
jgi:indole-3-glycerol phosphate synthase